MDIYLAGGFNGNMSPFWREYINGLAEGLSEQECYEKGRHTFLKGETSGAPEFRVSDLSILETFFYARKNEQIQRLLPYANKFLLDSGAFTFMQSGEVVDWNRYANEYADFINKNNIDLFFELDVDSIIGTKRVEELRELIERRTKKKSIPVWHIERGKQYYLDMLKEYPYVALGNLAKVMPGHIVIKEKYFNWFLSEARKRGVKVHALGYTPQDLSKYRFTSVDSTAWLYGNIGGFAYKFDVRTGTIRQVKKPDGHRMNSRAVAFNNYCEWVRYMKYAREYL